MANENNTYGVSHAGQAGTVHVPPQTMSGEVFQAGYSAQQHPQTQSMPQVGCGVRQGSGAGVGAGDSGVGGTGFGGRGGATGTGGPGRSSGSNGSGGSGGSGKRTALVVCGIILAAIAIWVIVWIFACNGPSMFDPDAQTGQAPYKTEAEIQAELERTVEEGMFNISIASVIQFADGTSSGTAYIENVPGNRYLMQVTITDDDTEDVLYESGVLQPNQFIENITLTKDLDQGTYPATATFTALDETTREEIGQAAAKVTISVLG